MGVGAGVEHRNVGVGARLTGRAADGRMGAVGERSASIRSNPVGTSWSAIEMIWSGVIDTTLGLRDRALIAACGSSAANPLRTYS